MVQVLLWVEKPRKQAFAGKSTCRNECDGERVSVVIVMHTPTYSSHPSLVAQREFSVRWLEGQLAVPVEAESSRTSCWQTLV